MKEKGEKCYEKSNEPYFVIGNSGSSSIRCNCMQLQERGSNCSNSAGTTAGGSQETVASADGIGFPKDETITLVVPGKAGGGSNPGIRYYSEGLNRLYGLKTTVTNYDSNTVGHQTVANAKPDGTTLTVAKLPH